MTTIDSVLEFWFGADPSAITDDTRKRWFMKDPAFDEAIREQFGAAWEQAVAGELSDWEQSPRGALAVLILLDQFSRNLWRGDPRTWAQDEQARGVMRRALERGFDRQLGFDERSFLYMPLMHSEVLADQEECVTRFEQLRDEGGQDVVKWAVAHRDIVARFGRFPHRNEVLGRRSTPEEESFLQEPGSSF